MNTSFSVELLQKLIQFNTTNPPGKEAACIQYVNELLNQTGIETMLLACDPERPNLVARIGGQGQAASLLLYGHVDVVTTEEQDWQHAPFSGEVSDGYIWGRGALDMKGGVAMLVSAFLRAHQENLSLPGDVILVLVSDEEAGGDFGARYLVEEHPGLFKDVRYALGEFGGFSMNIGNRRFYPIQVAEKQICWLRLTFRGAGGHGSLPVQGGAMAKLAAFLQLIDRRRLPVHVTPVAKMMLDRIANEVGGAQGAVLRQLTNPGLTNRILDLLGEKGRVFDPLLHHTVSPTILQGSSKINVIPSEVSLELDGRLLPGFSPQDLMAELRALAGDDFEIEVVRHDPGPSAPDMAFFDTLAGILREADPQGIPAPLLLSGVTDGRFFSRLGIQTYGYLPMRLPEDFNFIQTIHAANERIPVEALEFGTQAIYQAIRCPR